jgi:hypothetical protein
MERSSHAHRIAEAIRARSPFLQPVGIPWIGGLFGQPGVDPELYPDDTPKHGFLVPVPPPPPFRIRDRQLPTLWGLKDGRPWRVDLLEDRGGSVDALAPVVRPTLLVHSFARLLASDLTPFPVYPWVLVATDPGPRRGQLDGRFNFARRIARVELLEAGGRLGRPAQGGSWPPARGAVVVEAWDPAVRAAVATPEFLQTFADWQMRAGFDPTRPWDSPVTLRFVGAEVRLTMSIDLEADPDLHARTVAELVDLVPRVERALTGRDPIQEPMPFVDLGGPPGSIPDLRPAFRCPKCGAMESLRTIREATPPIAHLRSLRCGVDIFPPHPSRVWSRPEGAGDPGPG